MDQFSVTRRRALPLLVLLLLPATAYGQLGDALLFPKTIIDRAIEARSMSDIAKDNEIVLKVNRVMAPTAPSKPRRASTSSGS